MTPAEAAAFLRRYNEWRRTDDRYGMPCPDPREIGEAIDAAVEMIERLEAAESSVAWHQRRVGTDLTDEALAALPKGRHMLGIVGTYGVDGYVPAQPAPSIPEGWKKELFCIQHAMAMNNWDWESDASNDMKRAAYAAVVRLRAAAPEAKP